MTKLEVVASVWIDAGSDDELQINSIWPNVAFCCVSTK